MSRQLNIMSAFATSRAGSTKFWDAYEEYVRRLFDFDSKHQLNETEKLIIFRMCVCLTVSRKFKDVTLVNSGIVKFLECENSPFELSKLIKFVGPHMTDFETVKQIVNKYTDTINNSLPKDKMTPQMKVNDKRSIKQKVKDFKSYEDKRVKFKSFTVNQPPKSPQA